VCPSGLRRALHGLRRGVIERPVALHVVLDEADRTPLELLPLSFRLAPRLPVPSRKQ
jgi:hypothetical protein